MADALASIVLLAGAVGMVVSVAMLMVAGLGMLLTRGPTTRRREPQRPRG